MKEGSRSIVLFDLYGTLADIETDESSPSSWEHFRALATATGLETALSATELRESYQSLCEQEAVHLPRGAILEPVFDKISKLFSGADGSAERIAGLFREATTKRLELRPYTTTLLASLEGHGVKIGLISNTEALLTRFDLDALGISGRFDSIVLSSDVGYQKPHPEIYHRALEDLGTKDVSDAVMVGDTDSTDGLGARSVGMCTILLDPSACSVDSFEIPVTIMKVPPDERSIRLALRAAGVPN